MTVTTPTPALRDWHSPGGAVLEGPRVLNRLAPDTPAQPYSRCTVIPLGSTIGAELHGIDLAGTLDDEQLAEIHRALLEWKVVFFRDQQLDSETQRAFAMRWGSLETNPLLEQGDSAEVARLAKDQSAPGYENVWHTDVSFRAEPAMGAVLRAVDVPPRGGDTIWADMAAAYDSLSPELQQRIEGRTAVHDFIPGFQRYVSAEKMARLQDQFPPVEHPVVRTHPETGRKTLFVNVSFTSHIVGMDRADSDELLGLLFQQAHVPEFQVRFSWRPGSVAFWDNRAVQHYAVTDYLPQRRVMERVAITGDRPY